MKKHHAILWASALLGAQALLAEYPRDAAARFKMKHGIEHPAVEREKREAKAAAPAEKESAQARPAKPPAPPPA